MSPIDIVKDSSSSHSNSKKFKDPPHEKLKVKKKEKECSESYFCFSHAKPARYVQILWHFV